LHTSQKKHHGLPIQAVRICIIALYYFQLITPQIIAAGSFAVKSIQNRLGA